MLKYLQLTLTSARMTCAPLKYGCRLLNFSSVNKLYYQVLSLPPILWILIL